jgi:hypothetical protein
MRRPVQFDGLNSVERLEVKISPTAQSVGGIIAAQGISPAVQPDDDDPPPEPEPPLPPYPGDNPPIDPPLGPPSGPAGPGS